LIERWEENSNELKDLVIVENSPCHSGLEAVLTGTDVVLLRLVPYSPMLNPVETICSKIKAFVKTNLRIPTVNPPGVVEQRLLYLIDQAMNTIVGVDCALAFQHTVHISNTPCSSQNGEYASWAVKNVLVLFFYVTFSLVSKIFYTIL
jgi:hypothetical protein